MYGKSIFNFWLGVIVSIALILMCGKLYSTVSADDDCSNEEIIEECESSSQNQDMENIGFKEEKDKDEELLKRKKIEEEGNYEDEELKEDELISESLESAEDDESTKEEVIMSAADALKASYVTDCCAIKNFTGEYYETFTVFAEEYDRGFVMKAAASYNMWGQGTTNVVFNVDKYKKLTKSDKLTFDAGFADGTGSRDAECEVNIYLDQEEKPTTKTLVSASGAPVHFEVDVENCSTMKIELCNHSGSQISMGFINLDTE